MPRTLRPPVCAWLLLSLAAYHIPDWRVLQWMTSIPGFLAIVLWWVVPESPKWLLSQGRLEEAEETIRKAAKENGKELPDTWKLKVKNERIYFVILSLIDSKISFSICSRFT